MTYLLKPTMVAALLVLLLLPFNNFGQRISIEKLEASLSKFQQHENYQSDTNYLRLINEIGFILADWKPDSAIKISITNARNCSKINFNDGEIEAYSCLGNAYQSKGLFDSSLFFYSKAVQMANELNYKNSIPSLYNNIGLVHFNQGNYSYALTNYFKAQNAAKLVGNKFVIIATKNNIGSVYFHQNKFDEAIGLYKELNESAYKSKDTATIISSLINIGECYLSKKLADTALQYLSKSTELLKVWKMPSLQSANELIKGDAYLSLDSINAAISAYNIAHSIAASNGMTIDNCKSLIGLAKIQKKQKKLDEALKYGLQGLQLANEMGQVQLIRDANEVVANIYEEKGDGLAALKYYKQYNIFADSLHNIETERITVNFKAENKFAEERAEFHRKTLQQRWIIFSVLAALATLLVIVFIIIRSRKKLGKTNFDLQQKNIIIKAQKEATESALTQLKQTQTQLIESEKLASLGELTAGIAHEIQNPLNFINNFSDLNKELTSELIEEVTNGNLEDVKAIANDISENSKKIYKHGKRADAIVKGMLQHSRTSTGQKEPTDINLLASEYLKLAFYGLKAKDKSFNAETFTDFDQNIGKINVSAQDIGRVFLNLINNAFYAAAAQRKKLGESFIPTVSISTQKLNNSVEVIVSDNGDGIPKSILSKIFQPFFTTKPTGEGTGLGLSMSYDIVTKMHNGSIVIETKEGGGTKFIINLPI